jgi:type I restriction enzyme S subunit
MSEWKKSTLGEIFEIARGGSPRPIDDFITDDPDGVNWVMISDAKSKYITSTKKRIIKEGIKKSREVQPGDFLLTNSMSFGRPYIMQTSGCIHDGWLVLSPRGEVAHPDYFYHLLGSDILYSEFERRAAGATVKNLNIELVKAVGISLPPLAEQRRIAEVLDKAEALRAKRRAALAQLDSLTQSLFLDLFGDPATNPRRWPKRHLEQLCSIDAPLVDPTQDEYLKLLHYGPDRIERDTGGLLPAKTVEEDGQISAKFLFDHDAILYSKIRPNLNKVALTKGRGLCSADVYPVLVKGDLLAREFLWCLLRGNHFLGYAAEFSNRANIPKINRDQFLGYSAICPPITLQREFARRVTAVEKLKTTQRAALAELDALFASLQHRAFRGDL